jgi:hypothetical protein
VTSESNGYRDSALSIVDGALVIRRYYFPWLGSKRLPLAAITEARQVDLAPLRGQWRLWGTSDPRYWANLDASRHRKRVGFVLETGRRVRPMVTPDDPGAFRQALSRAGVPLPAGLAASAGR